MLMGGGTICQAPVVHKQRDSTFVNIASAGEAVESHRWQTGVSHKSEALHREPQESNRSSVDLRQARCYLPCYFE